MIAADCTWSESGLVDLVQSLRLPDTTAAARGRGQHPIERAAAALGYAAEAIDCRPSDLAPLLESGGPAVLHLPNGSYIGLLRGRGRFVWLAGRIQPEWRVRKDLVLRLLLGRRLDETVERLAALVPEKLQPALREIPATKLLQEGPDTPAAVGWILTPVDDRIPIVSRVRRSALGLGILQTIDQTLWILSWWLLGRAILLGTVQFAVLAAWSLLLASRLPLLVLIRRLEGEAALALTADLRRRFLAHSMQLEPEQLKSHGAGHFMGRSLEADAMTRLALEGGFDGLLASVQLPLAFGIAWVGAGGPVQALVLLAVAALGLHLGRRYHRHRLRWTENRIQLGERLVERMVGHRTELVQAREGGPDEPERSLVVYEGQGRRLDRTQLQLELLPRLWMVLSLLVLTPGWLNGFHDSTEVAVGVGALLLGYQALGTGVSALSRISGAWVAWGNVRDLLGSPFETREGSAASARPLDLPSSRPTDAPQPVSSSPPLLQLQDVHFTRHGSARPILTACNLEIGSGNALLLQGPSGGGKSTLASILAGLTPVDRGLRLAEGLDLPALGLDDWRRTVSLVPQFHENHLFADSLAFNLLLGRRWPPTARDLVDAESVCRDLGLGNLLDRMPSGIHQPVGDTGWRLSHGEQGRIYIARGLLQGSRILILDESLGSLDTPSRTTTIRQLLQDLETLMIVDHD